MCAFPPRQVLPVIDIHKACILTYSDRFAGWQNNGPHSQHLTMPELLLIELLISITTMPTAEDHHRRSWSLHLMLDSLTILNRNILENFSFCLF